MSAAQAGEGQDGCKHRKAGERCVGQKMRGKGVMLASKERPGVEFSYPAASR